MPKADEKADHHVQGIWMASSQKVKAMDFRPGSLNICWLLNFNPGQSCIEYLVSGTDRWYNCSASVSVWTYSIEHQWETYTRLEGLDPVPQGLEMNRRCLWVPGAADPVPWMKRMMRMVRVLLPRFAFQNLNDNFWGTQCSKYAQVSMYNLPTLVSVCRVL